MTQFAITNGAGVVLRIEDSDATATGGLILGVGEVAIEVASPVAGWPDEPSPDAVLMIDALGVFSWIDHRDLAQSKADQAEVIRAAELAAVRGGFVWSTDTFASDEDSQRRITLAMTCAVVAQRDATSMSIDWPLADGSYRTLDEADLVALGQALHAHIAAQMATAQGLYASIAAATTNAEVMAVVWP